MDIRTAVLAALAGAAIAPFAAAQEIMTVISKTKVIEGSSTVNCAEVAIAASPIMWTEAVLALRTPSVKAISTKDSFQTVSGLISIAAGADPFVAESAQTGDLYVGGIEDIGSSGLVVSRKPLGAGPGDPNGGFSTPVLAVPTTETIDWDKPFAAIGPWPSAHSTPEVMYLGMVAAPALSIQCTAWTSHSSDSGTLGAAWPSSSSDDGFQSHVLADTGCSANTYGDGAYPVVVQSGAHAGRIILALAQRDPSCGRTLPIVTWSDTAGSQPDPNDLCDPEDPDSGRRWHVKQSLDHFGIDSQPLYTSSADNPFPSVAIDPTDPDKVYVAWIGSTTDGGAADIFVALGVTQPPESGGGLVFSAAQTVRVDDDMIRDNDIEEGQTDETKVSIVVDSQEGINLLYSRKADDLDGKMVVRLARWASFDSLANGDSANVISLTGSFDPWPSSAGGFDYEMLCLAGCHLYAAYPVKNSTTGYWDMWVADVRLNTFRCQPDPECWANCDGSTSSPVLNVADFTCFLQRFAEGETYDYTVQLTNYGNCDGSTSAPVLNVADFTCFLQKFAAGCG